MNMNIQHIPPQDIRYIRRTGPYGEGNFHTMESLKTWAVQQGFPGTDAVIYGIAQDDPRTTPPAECRYDACIVVEQDETVSAAEEGILSGTLPGGRYAVFQLPHTRAAMEGFWRDVWMELARQNCRPDVSRPIMECYRPVLLEQGLCEMCVPVAG